MAGADRVDLPDLVGFGYLAVVLARPGHDVGAVQLAGAVSAVDQLVLDGPALQAAEDDADLGRLPDLHRERDALNGELSATLGLGGRVRGFGAPPERPAPPCARRSSAPST